MLDPALLEGYAGCVLTGEPCEAILEPELGARRLILVENAFEEPKAKLKPK